MVRSIPGVVCVRLWLLSPAALAVARQTTVTRELPREATS
jgi:hypothetical protein